MSEPLRTDKMSITVPADVAAELRVRAGRGNVSAYVTHALVRQLEHDRLGDLVTALDRIHDPVTDDEMAAARAEWPGA
ncbi:CopG family transcriptional regulator [Streptosporangium sp. NPDC004379]|uniref:CopG family transcriptional regulator n=1 Tax=Streptosporangium sp. NPDC004379 TaxID=3366189 RepID=UPI0036CBC5D1